MTIGNPVLFHGSPRKDLEKIIPGCQPDSRDPHEVYATHIIELAVLYTLAPHPMEFYIDPGNKRIIIADEQEFHKRNRGGSIYWVTGDFLPGPDPDNELVAPEAQVLNRTDIENALEFLASRGYTVYADPEYFNEVKIGWNDGGRNPEIVPEHIRPLIPEA